MGPYTKTAPGEALTYRPADLSGYQGEAFCLRVTPEDTDLERCFFVYLDESFEDWSVGRLVETYFDAPRPGAVDDMDGWLEPWLRVDPHLREKYALLRTMFARVRSGSGRVLYYINHGPADPVDPADNVREHLGTSKFSDGSFDDKILDLVLEFHAGENVPPEVDEWEQFARTSTAGATGPTARVRRRRFLGLVVAAVVGAVMLPVLFFSCRGANDGKGGFGGGML